ncbi:hypothetical protein Glove_393g24 [Diversispora epigaea]|uniref:Uncharacterized protein n=1 Tax=Diversispora epigaea TaxID=1348612 RepID=A0A397H2D9_9GLOM|nr:hypothetical protein Glove_393g24 [Diversispora epigaea]
MAAGELQEKEILNSIQKNTEQQHWENGRTENKSKLLISSKISRHQKVRTAPGSRTAQEKLEQHRRGHRKEERQKQQEKRERKDNTTYHRRNREA